MRPTLAAHIRCTLVVVLLLLGGGLFVSTGAQADTAPPAGTPATVSADRLPTWQINGVVWDQAIAGNVAFAGGSFTKARPPGVAAGGAGEVAAQNFFAYDVTTGNRIASYAHSVNGQILAVTASPDQTRVYLGGDFTSIDGQARGHLAAINAATGALVPDFKPSVNGKVEAIAVSGSTVYAGGNFSKVGSSTRTRLAAFNPADGSLVTNWAPSADDNQVQGMALSPDGSRLVVGGRFSTLNHVSARGMGAISTAPGAATLPWAANLKILDYGNDCGITSISSDGSLIYGSGFAFGCGNFEGRFGADPTTGAIVFVNDCHGDTYDTFPLGQVLYSVGHSHDCRPVHSFPESNPRATNMRHALAETTYATGTNSGPDSYGWNYNGVPDSTMLQWFPELTNGKYTGQTQAAWTVTGNDDYIVLGGEFPKVNGVNQQGLVRFARRDLAPNKMGPVRAAGAPTPTASMQGASTAKITWQSTYDMDNANLTYNVYRSGRADPVGTVTGSSNFWTTPTLTYTDQGVPAGSYTYTVRASDPFGNTTTLPITNAVTSAGGGNTPPVASFTSSSTGLTAHFDGSGSSDPNGSIVGYSWDFGDGSPVGSGQAVDHVYAPGTYHVTLTVTDNGGASSSVTHDLTVPVATPTPTAAFTSSTDASLSASFDASSSSDPAGAGLSYTWDFGDLSLPGTGPVTDHTYAVPGTYPVTLTVTDGNNAMSSVTHSVTVPVAAGPTTVAADTFGRTLASGWGSADQGGPWTLHGAASNYSVGGGVGTFAMKTAGTSPSAMLNGVSSSNADTVVTFSPSKPATGGTYVGIVGRSVNSDAYQATVGLKSNGSASLTVSKVVGGTTTAVVASQTIAGFSYAAGDRLDFRFQVLGTGPTTLRARLWQASQPEPTSWQASGSDSAASLQAAGGIGLLGYLSSSSTNAPSPVTFDDLSVTEGD